MDTKDGGKGKHNEEEVKEEEVEQEEVEVKEAADHSKADGESSGNELDSDGESTDDEPDSDGESTGDEPDSDGQLTGDEPDSDLYVDMGDGNDSDFGSEDQKTAYREYRKELLQSQGFRITKSVPGIMFNLIYPVSLTNRNKDSVKRILECVDLAIKKRKPELKYVDLVHACVANAGGFTYYITFTATTDPSRPEETKTYQTKVNSFTKRVLKFRLAPDENPQGA